MYRRGSMSMGCIGFEATLTPDFVPQAVCFSGKSDFHLSFSHLLSP